LAEIIAFGIKSERTNDLDLSPKLDFVNDFELKNALDVECFGDAIKLCDIENLRLAELVGVKDRLKDAVGVSGKVEGGIAISVAKGGQPTMNGMSNEFVTVVSKLPARKVT